MLNAADLPDTIPVFPLTGALLLPRAQIPLHIFEPRYLAMLEDTLKTSHRLIGMVQPLEDGRSPRRLQGIGCAGRVTAFSETDDGRYFVTLTGVSRFRLCEEVSGFVPYRRFEVSWRGFDRDLGCCEEDAGFDRQKFFDLLGRYLEERNLQGDWSSLEDADDELLINSLSMLCPLEAEEKQALLEAPCLVTRRETLVTLLEYALCGGAHGEVMQ